MMRMSRIVSKNSALQERRSTGILNYTGFFDFTPGNGPHVDLDQPSSGAGPRTASATFKRALAADQNDRSALNTKALRRRLSPTG